MMSEVSTPTSKPELVRQRQEYIIRSSLRLFLKKGYHKATIRDVCRSCGMSIGGLYCYIQSKDDILRLIMDGVLDEWEVFLQNAKSGGRPSEVLATAIEEYLRFIDRFQDIMLVAYREFIALPEFVSQSLTHVEKGTVALFQDILDEGLQSGELEFSEGRLVAWDIVMMGTTWILKRWDLRQHMTLNHYIREQTKIAGDMVSRRTQPQVPTGSH